MTSDEIIERVCAHRKYLRRMLEKVATEVDGRETLEIMAIQFDVCPKCGGRLDPPKVRSGRPAWRTRTCYDCEENFAYPLGD